MSSDGGWATFVRALGLVPAIRAQPAVPQQPTPLSTTANLFTRLGKMAEGPATALEKWGEAASRVVWEVSETLRVVDELVEYHGGEEQGADMDTEEAWYGRRELVEQLVEKITVSRAEDGRAKIHIAYKFAPPVQAATGVTDHKTFEILAGDTPVREALERI